jgi:hypothetical protein
MTNRTHAWDSAVWRDTIPTQPGLLEKHLDTRIRERAAVLDLAEQIDRERRFGAWPTRRAGSALSVCTGPCAQGRRACPCPDACARSSPRDDDHADADGLGLWRGLVVAVSLIGLCAMAALGVARVISWLP